MIRVLIVDDHPIVRAGLASMLQTHPNLEVIGGVSDGSQMFALLRKTEVDVVLLDIRMPGQTGIDILQSLKAAKSALRVIVLTSYESDEYIYDALRAGARGYLLKACSEEEMIEAIQTVHEGKRFLPQDIAARFAELVPRTHLTARQREILDHMARGFADRQLAKKLGISLGLVRQAITTIIDSLGSFDKDSLDEQKPRRPTMADIARKAGVSMSTVSRILHNKGSHTEETRRAVMRVVHEHDFQRNDTAASLAMMRNSASDT